jgi:hypothetical protein
MSQFATRARIKEVSSSYHALDGHSFYLGLEAQDTGGALRGMPRGAQSGC